MVNLNFCNIYLKRNKINPYSYLNQSNILCTQLTVNIVSNTIKASAICVYFGVFRITKKR